MCPVSWEVFGGRRAYAPGYAWQTRLMSYLELNIDKIIDVSLRIELTLIAEFSADTFCCSDTVSWR